MNRPAVNTTDADTAVERVRMIRRAIFEHLDERKGKSDSDVESIAKRFRMSAARAGVFFGAWLDQLPPMLGELRNYSRELPDLPLAYMVRLFGIDPAVIKPQRSRIEGETDRERLEASVTVDLLTGCHIYHTTERSDGYAVMTTTDGRSDYAHRVAYREYVGEIPEGAIVMHRCANPRCCNPAHLRLGTPGENLTEYHALRKAIANSTRVREIATA